MFGGAYIRWEIYAMKLIGCATGSFLLCFIWYLRAISKFKPPGASTQRWAERRRGDLTEGFLRYEFDGAYICRGLYMEELIFGIKGPFIFYEVGGGLVGFGGVTEKNRP